MMAHDTRSDVSDGMPETDWGDDLKEPRSSREIRALNEMRAENDSPQLVPPTTIASVLAEWRSAGPLVHQATGIATLDKLTGGGLVFGSRVYVVGAPDAGKTGLVVQLADLFAQQGIYVGLLAVDEEAGDLVTRFAQRAGWLRSDCEERDSRTLESIEEHFAALPIRFYGSEHTIESASLDLATWAEAAGARAFFGIDSVQTVSSAAGLLAESTREVVTANVRAIRDAATRYRMLTVATSEMNRGAYRNADAVANTNDMAAAKESGAVEYSARVLLSMRSVKDSPDLVDCKVVKNKQGPPGQFHLALDRSRMLFTECDAPVEDIADAAEQRAEKATAQLAADVATAAALFAERGPIAGKTGLREAFRGRGVSNARIDLAFAELIESKRIVNEGNEKRPRWTLNQASSGAPK